MRLTLRTLLAYLDGILLPEDAQGIGKKIEESTFASDLIHRIRYLLMRPSKTEPSAKTQEPSLGPNTMAEYLDNTLSPTHVTEFEKVCLDSDVHLAEVAACHQILALVLGEPAEIDPASRQRMYELFPKTTTVETVFPISSSSEVVMPPPLPAFSTYSLDAQNERKSREKPTVPDYLREPTKNYRWVSIATASLIAVCLAIVFLMVLGRFEPGTTMGNMLVRLGIIHDKQELAAETGKAGSPQIKKEPTEATPQKPDEKALAVESKAPGQPAVESTNPPDTKQPPTVAADSDKTQATPPTEKAGTGDETAAASETAKAAESGPEPKTAVLAADQGPEKSGESQPSAPTTPKETETDAKTENADDSSATKPAEEKIIPPSERLGRYMSEDQILLKNSDKDGGWQRVAGKEFLAGNQQLLVLPTYRPEIALAAGVNLRVFGGTELELTPEGGKDPAGINIRFGRITAMPLANAGTRLRIIIGERTGVITFTDPDAVIAIDVHSIHAPGANPETESASHVGHFFVTSGQVQWDVPGQKVLDITGPAHFTLDDQPRAEKISSKDFPKWITGEPIGKLESDASKIITEALQASPASRPAQRGLMELAEHRRKEVRWLAIRCLGYLAYFDPMVMVLDDTEFKQEWTNYIGQLREAVDRDAGSAAAVRKSLESRYPQTAADMYRMLWGYSDKDLASGEDEKLVEFLENENLPLRVLSIWNLRDITGAGLYYRPEATAAKRQQPVTNWRQRLAAKEIRVKAAEEKAGNADREKAAETP
jgi:hypothetical protein